METALHPYWAMGYKSKSQIARVLTETWTKEQMYCPVCGWEKLSKYPNNKAVADFYCPNCCNQFEQKCKNGALGRKISDGAYQTFVQRITSSENPNFFIMRYSLEEMQVKDMYFIPKFFFTPEVVEKRKPLSQRAERSGWVGCNILLNEIPEQGRVPVIKNGAFLDKDEVLKKVDHIQNIRVDNIGSRGWLMDILHCVNRIEQDYFTLDMIYAFENELAFRHPDNHHVRDKIRQQLQQLRDRGVIEFLENGHYRKIK